MLAHMPRALAAGCLDHAQLRAHSSAAAQDTSRHALMGASVLLLLRCNHHV